MSATRHVTYPWDLQGTVDPRVTATPAPIGFAYRRTTTGDFFMKVSGSDTGWRICDMSSTSKQVFRYARQPGDTETIVINAAAGFVARSSVNYNVLAAMGEFTNLLVCACPPTLYLTTQFTLKLSAAPVVGDTFLFTVEDLT